MIVLGIESSCDETAAAVVRDGCEVLSSEVASQIAIHQEFGGVVPEIAARAHLQNIDVLVERALDGASLSVKQLDAIAVTQGPGLIGALLVGVSYAKGMALASRLPLIPVDHVHAHIHGALLGHSAAVDVFPCLALVASGGHTNLYFMPNACTFQLIACTDDDACGESFDKVAKLLGLGYPGGPKIEQLAAQAGGKVDMFPMPQSIEQKNQMRFSYSGLKTHMANLLAQKGSSLSEQQRAQVCAAFQDAALGQLVRKIATAERRYPQARHLLIAGGVAANRRFRTLMAESVQLEPIFPALEYCSDNAAMIASSGFHYWQSVTDKGVFMGPYGWDAYSRYDYASVMVSSVDGSGT